MALDQRPSCITSFVLPLLVTCGCFVGRICYRSRVVRRKGTIARDASNRVGRVHTAVVILCVNSGAVLSFAWYLFVQSASSLLAVSQLLRYVCRTHHRNAMMSVCYLVAWIGVSGGDCSYVVRVLARVRPRVKGYNSAAHEVVPQKAHDVVA
jgi:hypothetical protein